jgi:hypothetical protein
VFLLLTVASCCRSCAGDHAQACAWLGGSFFFFLRQLGALTRFPTRFVAPSIASKYDFDVPRYEGIDQVVEVGTSEEKL